jgi:outer membrane protein OmpA-like peptidoglycan-associated protein
MFSQDDDNQGLVLGLLFGLIAVVIALVVGVGIYKTNQKAAPAPAPAAEMPMADGSGIQVVDGVVKFFFASGKADVAAGANEALAEAVKAVAAGKTLVVSGFHDSTGDPAMNAELAKQRALAVRAALVALGVAEDKVEMNKPEEMQASGSDAQARRVEVSVQ